MHKLLLAGNTPSIIAYLESQKIYIQALFPALDIELIDTDSDYVTRYNRNPNRFPFILLLKHDSYKSSLNAKISNTALYDWLVVNSVK